MRSTFSWTLWVWLIAGATRCLAVQGMGQTEGRKPVVVELFTSEGCSDCPPADRLLEQLDKAQPYDGVQAIVLSEHVTYWDHLGWRDPYSLDEMTDRQQAYSAQFGLRDIYTPQMVVDGTDQFVGSDARALDAAMRAGAGRAKEELAISNVHWVGAGVEFSVRGTERPNLRLMAALAADETHSEVARGENAGRTLHHVAVVRGMKSFKGDSIDGRPLRLAAGGVPAGPIRLVVFTVDGKSGHIVGAAEQTVAR